MSILLTILLQTVCAGKAFDFKVNLHIENQTGASLFCVVYEFRGFHSFMQFFSFLGIEIDITCKIIVSSGKIHLLYDYP